MIVRVTESRVLKNGKTWNKDLMKIYCFGLEEKVSSIEESAK